MDRRTFIGASATAGAAAFGAGCTDMIGGDGNRETNESSSGDSGGAGDTGDTGVDFASQVPAAFGEQGDSFHAIHVDWGWYTEHQNVEITFDGEADVGWSLFPSDTTAQNPPESRILRTPVWGVYVSTILFFDQLGLFGKVADPILDQLGNDPDTEGYNQEKRVVEELTLYGSPDHFVLSGDLERFAFEAAISENEHTELESQHGFSLYQTTDQEQNQHTVAFNDDAIILGPGGSAADLEAAVAAYADAGGSVAQQSSVQDAAAEMTEASVMVGEFDGFAMPRPENEYADSGRGELPAAETVLHGFSTDGDSAEAEAIFSGFDGSQPSEDELQQVYEGSAGSFEHTVDDGVARTAAEW